MIETRVHRLPRRLVTDREAWITDRCRGKSVLHLGFVAHPFMDENVASGRWLHARIAGVASRIVGVDWATEEVALLTGRVDIGTVQAGDVGAAASARPVTLRRGRRRRDPGAPDKPRCGPRRRQTAAGHKDPKTTVRYDRARDNLDRAATYRVAAYVADDGANAG